MTSGIIDFISISAILYFLLGSNYDSGYRIAFPEISCNDRGSVLKRYNSATTSPSDHCVEPTSIGFIVLAQADRGAVLFSQKPKDKDVVTALQDGVTDLSHILDEAPTVSGVFSGTLQQRRGGAVFDGKIHGCRIRGVMLCGVGDKGAAIAIAYAQAIGILSVWSDVASALPTATQLRQFQIANGGGTISLPTGWRGGDISGVIRIDGPNHEHLQMEDGLTILEPDSAAARAQAESIQKGVLAPGNRLPVAQYAAPRKALPELIAEATKINQANGNPQFELGKINQTIAIRTQNPSHKADGIDFSIWVNSPDNGSSLKRVWERLETYPISDGAWRANDDFLDCYASDYKVDMPTMITIAESWTFKDSFLKQNPSLAARFAGFRDFLDTVSKESNSFRAYEASARQASALQAQSNTELDLMVRDYRIAVDYTVGPELIPLSDPNELFGPKFLIWLNGTLSSHYAPLTLSN